MTPLSADELRSTGSELSRLFNVAASHCLATIFSTRKRNSGRNMLDAGRGSGSQR